MAFLTTADGVELYFEHHEPPGNAKATILFSCAYCTTHENWRPQVEPIVAAGYGVVLWDLRGHGKSEAPDGAESYSMEHVVSDLRVVAEATTPELPFVAAGLSFGGLASLHFAVQHLDRIAGLVLIGSGPGFKKKEAAEGWAAQVERTASFLEKRGFEDFVNGRAGSTCIGLKPEEPAAQAAARAIIAQGVPGVARFGREVSGLAPSVIDDLAGLSVPAIVLVGEHDKAFLRAGEVMAAKLPQAKHVAIPDAGHIVNLDQTERCNQEIIDFLDSL